MTATMTVTRRSFYLEPRAPLQFKGETEKMSHRNKPEAKAKRREEREAKRRQKKREDDDIAMFNGWLLIGFMLLWGGSDWLNHEQTQSIQEKGQTT